MPDQTPKFHEHPRNMHDKIYGVLLTPGDTIEPTDLYQSSNGYWEKATCAGCVLGEGGDRIWVRPMPLPEGTIVVETPPRNSRY